MKIVNNTTTKHTEVKMENKQTAVEFIVEQITKHTWYDEEGFGHVSVSILDIEQAKQIDKEQRIQDMSKMQIISDVDFDGNVTFMFSPEQYYNKTYGGNK